MIKNFRRLNSPPFLTPYDSSYYKNEEGGQNYYHHGYQAGTYSQYRWIVTEQEKRTDNQRYNATCCKYTAQYAFNVPRE